MGFWGDQFVIYTRKQAIADGVLVDLTEWSKETGIKYPLAVTRAVWDRYIEVPEGVTCQDVRGRAHDVLWMFYLEARKNSSSELRFTLLVRNDNRSPKPVTLKAICGPGDDPKPVITIMLPEED